MSSAVSAAALGCGVAALVAVGADAGTPFAGVVVGLALLGAGARSRRRIGPIASAGGVLLGLGAAAVAANVATDLSALAVVPSAVGAFVLGAGLATARRPRFAVTAGTGALLLAVLTAGTLGTTSVVATVAGVGGTVLAWDLGQQAVDIGEWGGETRVAEAVHAGGSVVVATLGVAAAMGSSAVGTVEASLPTVLLALAGVVGFALLLSE